MKFFLSLPSSLHRDGLADPGHVALSRYAILTSRRHIDKMSCPCRNSIEIDLQHVIVWPSGQLCNQAAEHAFVGSVCRCLLSGLGPWCYSVPFWAHGLGSLPVLVFVLGWLTAIEHEEFRVGVFTECRNS